MLQFDTEELKMGAKLRFLGVNQQDGEWEVNPSTAAYVQGQPLKFNTSGQLELCLCYRAENDDGYCGLAKGFSGSTAFKDSDIYNGKATYWPGFNSFKLDNTDPKNPNNDDYPYDTTLTYLPGDDIYIDANGKLTNNGPGAHAGYADVCASATPIAYVIAVATGILTINQIR